MGGPLLERVCNGCLGAGSMDKAPGGGHEGEAP